MANTIIKGNALMLFDNSEHSIAYATNHTLTLTAELSEVSSKDHGMWPTSSVQKYSWEITAENLFSMEDYFGTSTSAQVPETGFDAFDKWSTGTIFTVKFGLKGETVDTILGQNPEYWTLKTTGDYLVGQVIISSLTLNANNGDNATYSVTLKGVGPLEHKVKPDAQ